MISIRGAITVHENSRQDILDSTKILLLAIMENNQLVQEEVISAFFTATADLTEVYPAVVAREIGLTECSLLCAQEMNVEGSLKKCIRVMMHVNKNCSQKEAIHVYLREAKSLRPDLHHDTERM